MKETIFSLKGRITLSFNKPYAQRIDPLGNEGMRRSSVSKTGIPERWVGNGSHIFDVHFLLSKMNLISYYLIGKTNLGEKTGQSLSSIRV